MKRSFWSNGVTFAIIAAVIVLIVRANRQPGRFASAGAHAAEAAASVAPTTLSREGLQQVIAREQAAPAPSIRSTRVRRWRWPTRCSGRLACRAMQASPSTLNRRWRAVLHDEPLEYDARRMLGAVYLSQHRFRDAIREGERARDQRPRDDWNYGVIGDGHLELGEYDQAFAAFQTMMNLRPTAGAYARAAYALELRGRLDAALEAMQLVHRCDAPQRSRSAGLAPRPTRRTASPTGAHCRGGVPVRLG